MAASLDTIITLKVLYLFFVSFGYSFSQSTTSSTVGNSNIQPSPTVSASSTVNENMSLNVNVSSSGNESLVEGSVVGTSGIWNTVEAPSPSSVSSVQHSTVQVNPMPVEPDQEEIEQEFGPIVEELGQTFSKKIDPLSSNPSDVIAIKKLVPMMEKGVALLRKYNESGNATIDYFNITDSLVLIMKKFDCIEDRAADIPDRTNKSTRQGLQKVKDYVALKFNCPRIQRNATHPENSQSRKRRNVQIEVTMESAERDEDEFDEFQLLHHHSRFRRNAVVPEPCRPLKCGVQRFQIDLVITNRTFDASLRDTSGANYKDLTDQLTTTLKRVLSPNLTVDKIHNIKYDPISHNLKAVMYLDLDVNGADVNATNVIAVLESAAANDTLEAFEVDKTKFEANKLNVVDGNYTTWTKWGVCDKNYDITRTRECKGVENGGQCYGHAKETRKCDCFSHKIEGGNITSPLFPKNYPTGVKCVWVLEAPENHTVKLFLNEFKLEKDKKCFYDYMEFFEGNSTDEQHMIGNRLCGTHGPRAVESKGQKLSILFNSDKSDTYRGFHAHWQTKEIKEKVIEYVPQYITSLAMIYSPNVNGTHYPLGIATTCTDERRTSDQKCIFKEKVLVISRLISSHIDRDLSLAGGNIVINFEHIMNEKLFPTFYNGKKHCVSWNKNAKFQDTETKGGWTRRGCSVLKTNITHTSCACGHQGLFAVLGQEKIESGRLKLLANTYIGLGISYFILILAIVHIVWKIEVHGGEVMRINMCAAIIIMQSVFLIGAHVKAQQTLCGFLSFAVYFSVLAEFCWLLLHGLRIHGKIKKIFASNLNIEIVYVVIGWGLPLLLALIAIGVQIDLKNPDDVCWEAAAGSSMWGYALPVVIISLFNVAVLLKLLIPTQDVRNGYDYEEMRYRVLKDFVFLLCFGLTCTFAYQAVEEERFLEQYLLSAFVIMQALAMFVFGREGRKDFVKRVEETTPEAEPEPANEEPEENIYEEIKPEMTPEEKESGKGRKRTRKRASKKAPETITVPTLKNLNIYKEGDQYVIEA